MSKFLKFIVNLVILSVVLIALALMVPQFLGIETVMNDNTEMDTNLPIGSVAYGKSVSASQLKKGDQILYSEGQETYVYEITDMDATAGSYQVKDVYSSQSSDLTVKISKNVAKVILVVPLIGYAAIALQTTEGLIVVGLGIVFLIILFVLSELWRKDRDEDDEDEEDEEEEEYEEEDEDEDEVPLSRRERRRLKKEEKRRRKLEKKGYEEEEEEDILVPLNLQSEEEAVQEEAEVQPEASEEIQVSEPETVEDATIVFPDLEPYSSQEEVEEVSEQPEEESLEEIPEEPLAVTAVLPDREEILNPETEGVVEEEIQDVLPEIADIEEVLQDVEEEDSNSNYIEETAAPAQEAIRPDMVPVAPTVEELLAKAQAAGENPEIKKDEENHVTILDYSDIL